MMKNAVCLMLVLLYALVVRAQTDATVASFNIKEEFREQLVLQTNNQFYIPGERILFSLSAKLRTGDFSFISKVAYVELVDQEKKPVLRTLVSLQEGKGQGHLYLPSYLKTGNYVLLAYTSWMRNFPPSCIPTQSICVVNPHEPGVQKKETTVEEPLLHFFPEGGGYLFNKVNKVAYVLTPAGATDTKLSGRLLNQHGAVIASFSTSEKGIGHFSFTPTASDKYRVVLSDSLGRLSFHALPIAQESKLGLQVKESIEAFVVEVTNQTQREQSLSIFADCSPDWAKTHIVPKDGSINLTLYKNELPSGLLQLSVGDTSQGFFARRLIFNPYTIIAATATTDKKTYKPREKVMLSLQVPGQVESMTLTVTVHKVYGQQHTTSVPVSVLSSGIKEPLVDLAYYLNPNHAAALDDLLITRALVHGNLTAEGVSFLPDHRGQLISGKVKGPPGSEPLVYLVSTNNEKQLYVAQVDKKGRFFFNLNHFTDKGEYVLYTYPYAALALDQPYLNDYSFVSIHECGIDPAAQDWLVQKSIDVQVENAYYNFKQDLPLNENSPSFLQENITKTYKLSDYTRFPTIQEVIIELIPEMRARKSKGKTYFVLPGVTTSSSRTDTALVLLNGIPVSAEMMLKLDPKLVDKIELVLSRFVIGGVEFQGAVNFQTLENQTGLLSTNGAYRFIQLPLVQQRLAYYQPDHEQMSKSNERMPDFRSQLLWEPHLLAKDNTLSFYTSDLAGTFRVVVQGIDPGGKIVYSETTFRVVEELDN